jgi:hypothetical protein
MSAAQWEVKGGRFRPPRFRTNEKELIEAAPADSSGKVVGRAFHLTFSRFQGVDGSGLSSSLHEDLQFTNEFKEEAVRRLELGASIVEGPTGRSTVTGAGRLWRSA